MESTPRDSGRSDWKDSKPHGASYPGKGYGYDVQGDGVAAIAGLGTGPIVPSQAATQPRAPLTLTMGPCNPTAGNIRDVIKQGFTEEQARLALSNNSNDVDDAVQMLVIFQPDQ